MAATVFMQRVLGSLRPCGRAGAEVLDGIGPDEVVKVEISRPRNVLHHRKFFALLDVIFPHQDEYVTEEDFRAAFTCALGYCTKVKTRTGATVLIPKSISFAKMDQRAFEQFFDRALLLITTRILPGIDRADVEREVAEILAGRNREPQQLSSAAKDGREPNKPIPRAA